MVQSTALTFSLTNILKFMSYLSPLLITFFMIMYSILTNNIIKGLIFMTGLVIITFINYLLKNTVKSLQSELASPFCNTLPAPFTFRSENSIFDSPSTSSTIIAFASSFLIYPMFQNNNVNYPLMIFLILLTGINGSVEITDKCTSSFGVFLGILVGVFFGILYYSMIIMSGSKHLAYFTEIPSDNIQCSKPGKKQFKCEIKNKDPPGQRQEIRYTLSDADRNAIPQCRQESGSIYAYCGERRILEWDNQNLTSCQNDAHRGRWKTCGSIFDINQDFREGRPINIINNPIYENPNV